MKLVHPLPAWAEDELGVKIQVTINAANTAAGSGLHDASCSAVWFRAESRGFNHPLRIKDEESAVRAMIRTVLAAQCPGSQRPYRLPSHKQIAELGSNIVSPCDS